MTANTNIQRRARQIQKRSGMNYTSALRAATLSAEAPEHTKRQIRESWLPAFQVMERATEEDDLSLRGWTLTWSDEYGLHMLHDNGFKLPLMVMTQASLIEFESCIDHEYPASAISADIQKELGVRTTHGQQFEFLQDSRTVIHASQAAGAIHPSSTQSLLNCGMKVMKTDPANTVSNITQFLMTLIASAESANMGYVDLGHQFDQMNGQVTA